MTEDTVDWRSLFGYFSPAAAVGFIRDRGMALDAQAAKRFAEEVSRARHYVSSLGSRGSVSPKFEDFPRGHEERLARIRESPEFSEYVTGALNWSFGMVELAKLRVYQPHINLERARMMVRKAPDPGDVEGTVSYCLPLKGETLDPRTIVNYDEAQKAYSLVSESPDMRVLGSVKLEYAKKRMGVGFIYGFGHAELSVVRYKGIPVLMNGYHRAYALLKKGHSMVPSVLVTTDDFGRTGMNQPLAFPFYLVASDRAPIMQDFLSPAAVIAPWKRTRTILTVHAGVEIVQL